jgi:hypothetical protein
MAESDRQRLLERALALPRAHETDFYGGRRPPEGVDPEHLRVISDTSLRTRLIEVRLAEGLQSPKGPQKIASILRIYPNFDAPPREKPASGNGRPPGRPRGVSVAAARSPARALPTLEELEALVARLRETERQVTHELSADVDDRIERLKRAIAEQHGDALEATYRELGLALDQKRALAAHARAEAFRRVEADADFAPRAHLRLLAR